MENVLSFLSSLDDTEIQTILVFLKEYVKSRNIESKLERCTEVLKLQGATKTQIEHSKICKLRSLGIITVNEEIERIKQLYINE